MFSIRFTHKQACCNSNFTLGCRIPVKTAPWDANLPIGMLHPERNGIGMQIHLYLWGVLLGCHQKIGDERIRSSKQAGRTEKRTWDAVGMLRQEKGTRLNLGCSGDALGANSGKPDVTTLSMQADRVKECIQNAVGMHLG